jgi:hypothetical protein
MKSFHLIQWRNWPKKRERIRKSAFTSLSLSSSLQSSLLYGCLKFLRNAFSRINQLLKLEHGAKPPRIFGTGNPSQKDTAVLHLSTILLEKLGVIEKPNQGEDKQASSVSGLLDSMLNKS